MEEIDGLLLNFDQSSIWILNGCLALIMYGVALDVDLHILKSIFSKPKALIVGLVSQWLVLPLLTFVLISLCEPIPSFALGMILVSACPGGNISNFFSALAGAKVELSISLTMISSFGALIFTPLIFTVYGNLYGPTKEILQEISIDWKQIVLTIFIIIIVPVLLGQLTKRKAPRLAVKLKRGLRLFSMLLFIVIVLIALLNNLNAFKSYIGFIFLLVFVHNAVAILIGYCLPWVFKLDYNERSAIAIETGIQNSGLGLLIIFNFFNGLGGMAIIAAWWGIWHIITGFGMAYYLKKRPIKTAL